MLTSFFIIIAAFAAQQPLQVPKDMNWQMQQANMSVPDPTRPDAMPNLGYTGIWRSIYGARSEVQVDRQNGFSSSVSLIAGPPNPVTLDRQPHIRTAEAITIDKGLGNLPSFDVPRASLDKPTAAFVWHHQLEEVNDAWSIQSLARPTTSASRDDMPIGTINFDEGPVDWQVEGKKGNYYLTGAVAVVAVLLLIVTVFMPK